MQAHTKNLKNALALCGLLASLMAAPAFADESADISKMMRAGQLPEALVRVDTALKQRPRDPQLRFLRGLILTEQNKTAEAISAFTKLTEDFPDLPEPYNNLAVLFASTGQYDKARAALDMAIRTNPTYATAHENLGDVYAKLASQAYDKALQIDSGNSGARSKLTLVKTLTGNTTGGTAPAKTTAAAAAASVAAAPPAVAQAPAPAKPVPPPARADATAAASPAAATPAIPAPKPAADKAEPATNAREEVLDTLNGWAKAWSDQDMKAYLAYYGDNFETPGGVSRKSWEQTRRSRIEGKNRISVKIDAPQVSLNGDSATVRFRQTYLSDKLDNVSQKTIVFNKQNGKWLIQQEKSGG